MIAAVCCSVGLVIYFVSSEVTKGICFHIWHVYIQYQQCNGNSYYSITEGFNAACITIIVGLISCHCFFSS